MHWCNREELSEGGSRNDKEIKQARAREFNTTSRQSIKERDQNQCIFCQMEYRMEEVEWTGQGTLSIMHYIPRSHGGLGIPQNGALGCIAII